MKRIVVFSAGMAIAVVAAEITVKVDQQAGPFWGLVVGALVVFFGVLALVVFFRLPSNGGRSNH